MHYLLTTPHVVLLHTGGACKLPSVMDHGVELKSKERTAWECWWVLDVSRGRAGRGEDKWVEARARVRGGKGVPACVMESGAMRVIVIRVRK